MMIRIFALAFALAGCSGAPPAKPPTFNALIFFTGASRGEGTLKVIAQPTVPVHVTSHGRTDGKGGIILDQAIREGSKPARQRRWVLRPTSAATLTGTVTDNPGRVRGRMDGNRLLLDYTMKGGLNAEQVLTIQPGGRSMVNSMTVRKFGIPVAHVNELITKVG